MATGNVGQSSMPPPLIKGRYGEPMLTRIYNNTPVNREENDGFGRNETAATLPQRPQWRGKRRCHRAPTTFPAPSMTICWSTTLARRDKINTDATDRRASGPDGSGGLINVAGDFRELQGTLWAHDHRFFFTAENVYKGNIGAMINYYSGPDRGNEELTDGVNLRLPSGKSAGLRQHRF